MTEPRPQQEIEGIEGKGEGEVSPVARPLAWSWPNFLSLTRVILAPLLAWLIVRGRPEPAVLIFAIAIATDFVDGPLARRSGRANALGALLDHGSDATFVTLGLVALAILGLVPVYLPPLVALAFLQYSLDSRALQGRVLRASTLGRWNGIFYYVLVGTPIVRDTLGLAWPSDALILMVGWMTLLATFASMVDRLWVLLRGENVRP
jgi:phosphatidylglycerophosphate synthase